MKTKLFIQFGSMLLAMIMFTNCEKPIQELDQSDEVFLKSGSKNNAAIKYRLLVDSGLNDGFIRSYQYNDKGLADEFHMSQGDSYSFSATMKYNKNNLMSKAKASIRFEPNVPEREFDLVFTYHNDKLVKETWYYPGTKDVYDYYINTYNKNGQLIKRDNPPVEQYCLFHYDNAGNCKIIEIYNYDKTLYVGYKMEYSRKYKNPFASVTGLPVTWFFTDDLTGPYMSTGIKQYINDENGNRVVTYQWKSEETEIKTGPHHYPIYQNSRDVISDTWSAQVWKYESYNRKRESDHHHHKGASIGQKSSSAAPGHYKFKEETFRQKMKKMGIKHENENRAVTE